MTVMSRKQSDLLAALVKVAGDARYVEQALREMNDLSYRGEGEINLEDLVRRILEIREHAKASVPSSSVYEFAGAL